MSRELRSLVLRSLGFFVILEGLIAIAIVWWPSFRDNLDAVRSITGQVPMLSDMADLIDTEGITAYVIAQHFFKACNTLGVTAAVMFAVGAVAGEAHRGTLELWLARPVSRTRLLGERYVLGWLAVAIPVFVSSATVPWLLGYVDETMTMEELMLCSVHSTLFLGCVFSLTFLWSCVSSEPLVIALSMLFFTIFEFAIYMVKSITHYSIFRHVDMWAMVEIVTGGGLDSTATNVMLGIHAACFVGALVALKRRVP